MFHLLGCVAGAIVKNGPKFLLAVRPDKPDQGPDAPPRKARPGPTENRPCPRPPHLTTTSG
jgi:hypothetical protein